MNKIGLRHHFDTAAAATTTTTTISLHFEFQQPLASVIIFL
jgi:hypothetical protein